MDGNQTHSLERSRAFASSPGRGSDGRPRPSALHGNGAASDPSCRLPLNQLDWKLVASMSLPGENAVHCLLDGQGRILDSTPGGARILLGEDLPLHGRSLHDLTTRADDLLAWLYCLQREDQRDIFSVAIDLSPSAKNPIRRFSVKGFPLFIHQQTNKSRAILKAAPIASEPLAEPYPVSHEFASLHQPDGSFAEVGEAWRRDLGFSPASLKGRRLKDIAHPDDRQAIDRLFSEAWNSQTSSPVIFRVRSPGRSLRTLLASGTRDEETSLISLAAKDLTLPDAHPALHLLRASVELVKDSVVLLARGESGFRICYVNKTFEQITGYSHAQVAGRSLACLNGPNTGPKAIGEMERALKRQEQLTTELLLYTHKGREFWSRTFLCPLRKADGQADFFIAILEDATSVRRTAQELEQRNAELKEALNELKETQKTIIQQENLRALGQMASGIAHDFNNLLAPILGFSELLLNFPSKARDEEKLVSYLKKIQIAAQDGAAVVSRLREFYRSQSEPEELTVVDPRELIRHVKEITKHRWKTQAEAKGIHIDFKLDFQSDSLIMGNEPELRQVFTNLVINAVDAIPQRGSITARLLEAGGKLRIEFVDTGTGMPQEIQRKCLDPFFTTKGKLGTGLGLSIAFGVVQRHQGAFKVESAEGKGTRIIMDFPPCDRPDLKPEAAPDPSANRTMRILLVDDEEILLEVISELLGNGGHVVDNFSDPRVALKAFKEREYDLVITDRAMPVMSGDQLAAAIKDLKPETPVFMVTGFGDLIKETGEKPSNIDEVLAKPLPLDLLNRKLAELKRHRSSS